MILDMFAGSDKSLLVVISNDKRTTKVFVELIYEEVLCSFYNLHSHLQDFTLMEDGTPIHYDKFLV